MNVSGHFPYDPLTKLVSLPKEKKSLIFFPKTKPKLLLFLGLCHHRANRRIVARGLTRIVNQDWRSTSSCASHEVMGVGCLFLFSHMYGVTPSTPHIYTNKGIKIQILIKIFF